MSLKWSDGNYYNHTENCRSSTNESEDISEIVWTVSRVFTFTEILNWTFYKNDNIRIKDTYIYILIHSQVLNNNYC